jgi:oligoendopeptidase F
MGMELLALPHLEVFYPAPADAGRSARDLLEHIITLFPWIATIDAFQHWLYTHQGHSREDRRAAWLATFRRFEVDVDFGGYEEAEAYQWHRQLHLFLSPFYYIEYGIAQIGALQVWRRARQDGADAVRRYRQALSLGGGRPLPELFAAAGAEFDFAERTLAPLVDEVVAALETAGPPG